MAARVLNAYYPLGHNPGGFRVWWRRLHGGSDDDLDNTNLMRFAVTRFCQARTSSSTPSVIALTCSGLSSVP